MDNDEAFHKVYTAAVTGFGKPTTSNSPEQANVYGLRVARCFMVSCRAAAHSEYMAAKDLTRLQKEHQLDHIENMDKFIKYIDKMIAASQKIE